MDFDKYVYNHPNIKYRTFSLFYLTSNFLYESFTPSMEPKVGLELKTLSSGIVGSTN